MSPEGQDLGTVCSGQDSSLPGAGVLLQTRHNNPFPHTRPPSSWNLEGLKALGPLATYISPSLWMQVQEVGRCPGIGWRVELALNTGRGIQPTLYQPVQA